MQKVVPITAGGTSRENQIEQNKGEKLNKTDHVTECISNDFFFLVFDHQLKYSQMIASPYLTINLIPLYIKQPSKRSYKNPFNFRKLCFDSHIVQLNREPNIRPESLSLQSRTSPELRLTLQCAKMPRLQSKNLLSIFAPRPDLQYIKTVSW